jgi:hypothetical protein
VFVNPLAGSPAVLVAAVGGAEGARPAAAALACIAAGSGQAALMIDVEGRSPRPTLLATAPARELEVRLVGHLEDGRVAARGGVCHLAVSGDAGGFEEAAAALAVVRGVPASVHVPAALVQPLLDAGVGSRLTGVLLRAELETDRALSALVVRDLVDRGLAVFVMKRRMSWVAERRALFGTLAPGAAGGPPDVLVDRLIGRPQSSVSTDMDFRAERVRDGR